MDDLLAIDSFLVLGQTDTQLYGNGVDGLVDDDGRIEFGFLGGDDPLVLSFDAYDVDNAKELAVEVNGAVVGYAARGPSDGYAEARFHIDPSLLNARSNTLAIVQSADPGWTWGAANILLEALPPLTVGAYETAAHGNGLSGAVNASGRVSFDFEGGTDDLTLFVQGFDIDLAREVEVFVNAQSLGFLSMTPDDGFGLSRFEIDATLMTDGTNTLEFVQTRSAEWTWGVTEIVLNGPGPYALDVAVDPEFLEDRVVWQTPTAFHMGRIDLNTGLMIETLVTAPFEPLPIGQTLQGPEVMRTSDGIVGIGMTVAGLVVFSEAGSRLLEGTEGMILGFLPKGVTPGLRFTMADDEANQYLYDNGDITLLDLDGGETSSWLNESEVVVSYYNTELDILTVYNVETGETTKVADEAYVAIGQQASITTESGERFIVINAGRTYDIWQDRLQGWTLIQTIVSPDPDWWNIDSVEIFEWNGGLHLSGILTDQPGLGTYVNTIPVLYDIFSRSWTELAGPGDYMDPEVVILNDGSLAFTYFDINRDVAEFLILSPEDLAADTSLGVAVSSDARAAAPAFGGLSRFALATGVDPLAVSAPEDQATRSGPSEGDVFVFRTERTDRGAVQGPDPALDAMQWLQTNAAPLGHALARAPESGTAA